MGNTHSRDAVVSRSFEMLSFVGTRLLKNSSAWWYRIGNRLVTPGAIAAGISIDFTSMIAILTEWILVIREGQTTLGSSVATLISKVCQTAAATGEAAFQESRIASMGPGEVKAITILDFNPEWASLVNYIVATLVIASLQSKYFEDNWQARIDNTWERMWDNIVAQGTFTRRAVVPVIKQIVRSVFIFLLICVSKGIITFTIPVALSFAAGTSVGAYLGVAAAAPIGAAAAAPIGAAAAAGVAAATPTAASAAGFVAADSLRSLAELIREMPTVGPAVGAGADTFDNAVDRVQRAVSVVVGDVAKNHLAISTEMVFNQCKSMEDFVQKDDDATLKGKITDLLTREYKRLPSQRPRGMRHAVLYTICQQISDLNQGGLGVSPSGVRTRRQMREGAGDGAVAPRVGADAPDPEAGRGQRIPADRDRAGSSPASVPEMEARLQRLQDAPDRDRVGSPAASVPEMEARLQRLRSDRVDVVADLQSRLDSLRGGPRGGFTDEDQKKYCNLDPNLRFLLRGFVRMYRALPQDQWHLATLMFTHDLRPPTTVEELLTIRKGVAMPEPVAVPAAAR